ncbi:hypothetical protein llap_9334 [Limosa lapponica baueri]|uniref:Uncharacterized protein n=1 Tax=Limosa lapponica baueri TaxID=1758121 RepID=A0A2I0U2W3_LIMLA|nr:hypothetical protein llap_9334 [Limosa lapponica baueri]
MNPGPCPISGEADNTPSSNVEMQNVMHRLKIETLTPPSPLQLCTQELYDYDLPLCNSCQVHIQVALIKSNRVRQGQWMLILLSIEKAAMKQLPLQLMGIIESSRLEGTFKIIKPNH